MMPPVGLALAVIFFSAESGEDVGSRLVTCPYHHQISKVSPFFTESNTQVFICIFSWSSTVISGLCTLSYRYGCV